MSDYVLGTHDDEIARLALQHELWRADAHAAWQRAGIAAGDTVIDVGCGPGFAARDLAQLVAPGGKVIALDNSRRFLDALAARGVAEIETHECDLARDALPVARADAAWARWIFCFVPEPRALLARLAEVVRPGGAFVAHEYFHYATWRASPRTPELDEFVAAVMSSWRARGGEPDIAIDLLQWLPELGFDVVATRPIVHAVAPGEPLWQWMASFVATGLPRLVELGDVSRNRADELTHAFAALAARPSARLFTPSVLEIVARRRT